MADRRDIPDALREAVERTVQATIETSERAQGAASEISASVDDLLRGAEKGLTRSRRSVRAAVGERLPATQEDVRVIRSELSRIAKRLDEIEGRLAQASRRASAAAGSQAAAKTRAKARAKPAAKPSRAKAGGGKAGGKTGGAKAGGAKARPRAAAGGKRAKPKR